MTDFGQLEQQNGLPPGLLNAVMQQESGGNPNAISPKGAMGAFQFMPQTAQQYGIDPRDPDASAQAAATMLGQLNQKYGGSLPHVLAGYNWGQGNVDRQGLQNAPPETQKYIGNIVASLGTPDLSGRTGPQSDPTPTPLPWTPSGSTPLPRQASNSGVMNAIGNFIMPSANAAEAQPQALPQGFQWDDQSQPQQSTSALPQGFQWDDHPQTSPGFLSRVGGDLSQRNQMMQNTAGQYQSGNLSLPETLLQGAGKGVFGAAGDIGAEGIKSLASYAPDWYKEPIVGAANELAKTDIGQGAISLAKQGIGAYQGFAQNHPRIAGDLEAVGNIVTGLPAAAGEKALAEGAADVTGQALSKTGDALIGSAAKDKSNFVKELVTPKITPTVANDQFTRSTEQGILRKAVVEPTAQEKSVIDTVSQLPVSGNKSLLANYNIISDANTAEAQSLISRLKANDVPIHDDHILNTLLDIRENLAASPYVTGDGAKAADKVINIALNVISDNEKTASGLLQARKDFDAEIGRMKGDKTFNPTLDSPITAAVQQVRQGINKMVDEAVPSVEVKQSLAKQSNMYRAMDNIESKGGAEGKNIVSRAVEKASNLLPGKTLAVKATTAIGGIGLAGVAPAFATAGLGAYGAGKALNSQFVKRNVGKALKGTGTAMRGGK